ncbi:MAG: PqqD family protein [SAR324 cluster bacterium]|uniref:PqqD family protein n=1 Tax=SAR324 cluster bacterium TaxID=2024889 RepID=A0A7X9FUE8_9DELT|nr:PqqD family protein [SAR324 cluster bacterium]
MADKSNTILFSRSTSAFWCELGEDAVVFIGSSGHYFGLNQLAAFVWQKLAIPLSIEQMTTLVVSEFDVPRAIAEADLRVFVEDMTEKGMLTKISASSNCVGIP